MEMSDPHLVTEDSAMQGSAIFEEGTSSIPKKKQSKVSLMTILLILIVRQSQNDMLHEWLEKQDEYMATLLDFEDIGSEISCAHCRQSALPLFRCSTCLQPTNYCQRCIVQRHQFMPFHRVLSWDLSAGCFQKTSLQELGLISRLGHNTTQHACNNYGSLGSMTVIHSNGLHTISIQFCTCPGAKSSDLQLFAFRLFPATVAFPQTAFSFEVLEQFRFHHLEGKGSVYTFMNSLYRLTDNTGCSKIEVCACWYLSMMY
jgi:hypothetical protein